MDQVVLHTTTVGPEAEVERQLFKLIQTHADEPAPFNRIASHEIVTRLRLVPASDRSLSFSDSCRTITSSLKGDA
jgi:hypothetical protein